MRARAENKNKYRPSVISPAERAGPRLLLQQQQQRFSKKAGQAGSFLPLSLTNTLLCIVRSVGISYTFLFFFSPNKSF